MKEAVKTILISFGTVSVLYMGFELLRLMNSLNDGYMNPLWEFIVIMVGIFIIVLVFIDHFTEGNLLVN